MKQENNVRRKTEMNIENFRANTKIFLLIINLQKNDCLLNNVSFQSFVNVQKHNWFLYIDFVRTTLSICLLLLTIFGGVFRVFSIEFLCSANRQFSSTWRFCRYISAIDFYLIPLQPLNTLKDLEVWLRIIDLGQICFGSLLPLKICFK